MTTSTEETTTTNNSSSKQQQQADATAACLDFRDIHQHPPAAVQQFTPLPADPSWDAHKVYFNERPKPAKVHGDEIDAVFAHVTPQIAFEQCDEKKQADDDLDPLGWPVAPPVFSTTTTQKSSTTAAGAVTLSLSYDVDDDDDVGDEDDLNLLRRRSDADNNYDDEDAQAILTEQTVGEELVSGIETAYQGTGTAVVGFRVPSSSPMSKQARIQQYETTGVDEESSVEEADDDDSDDDDNAGVNYLQQAEPDDDDDECQPAVQAFASFDTECHVTTMTDRMAASSIAAPQLVLDDKVMAVVRGSSISKKKKTKNEVIPLLRPPPAEKLAAWEKSKKKP